MRTLFRPLLLALALVSAIPVQAKAETGAETERGQFKVRLAGITLGSVAYALNQQGTAYAAAGEVRALGVGKLVLGADVDVSAEGWNRANSYRPSHYSATTRDDDSTRVERFAYVEGTPEVTRTPPRKKPGKHDAPASAQAGTVDPLTLSIALLRDRPLEAACDLHLDLFDGRKRSEFRLVELRETNKGYVCAGEFRREQGYSPEEMETPFWRFELVYRQVGDVLRVTTVNLRTRFGAVRLSRT